MKIQDEVLSPYEIWQDDKNYTVGVPKTQKDGSVVLNNASYFTSLAMCLLHIVKLKMVKEGEVVNLNQYIKDYISVKDEILNQVKL